MFIDILGINYHITEDIDHFVKQPNPKINYTDKKINDALQIIPHSLLFEQKIKRQTIDVNNWNGCPVFFQTNPGSLLPFDIFAAAFYLVTRYEEYLASDKDMHGRFPFKASLAYQNGFIKQPVVNLYADALKRMISDLTPDFDFPERKFEFLPTIDVDYAYAYRNRGGVRTMAGLMKDFALRRKSFHERLKVIRGKQHDPYDSFDMINRTFSKTGVSLSYFLQVGRFGRYDHNLPVSNHAFRELIIHLSNHNEVGIHPSYRAHDKPKLLEKEKADLEKITGKDIVKSRQHFLRLSFPHTYRQLINAGIKEDYTLGYAEHIGFRPGVCTPFNFFDLEENRKTGLRIFPFQVMDGTLRQYMGLSPEKATDECIELINQVWQVNGTFILLWHNSSFGDNGKWKGWTKVFNNICDYALKLRSSD